MTSTTAPASRAIRNTRLRTTWGELPDTVRRAVESAAGGVLEVEPISAGLNCGIAALLGCEVGVPAIKVLEGQDVPSIKVNLPEQGWRNRDDVRVDLGFSALGGDARDDRCADP